MELTKQYLDARIKQLKEQLADEEEMYYTSGAKSKTTLETLLQELLTLKDLFDEEHERIGEKNTNPFIPAYWSKNGI